MSINILGIEIEITLGGLLLIIASILQSLLMYYSYILLQHKTAELQVLIQALGGI